MDNFSEMIRRYSIRNADKVKKLFEPLTVAFGISYFHFHRVTNDGLFTLLSYPTHFNEFFYAPDMRNKHPYILLPKHVETGLTICENQPFPGANRTTQFIREELKLECLPGYILKDSEGYCAFSWSIPKDVGGMNALLAYDMGLMLKFLNYAKGKVDEIAPTLKDNPIDLKEELGDVIDRPFEFLKGISGDTKEKFLKGMGEPIRSPHFSDRERQCIDLYLLGYSASQTSEILSISVRTVESYFENIKNKLACGSKREVLFKIREMKDLSLYTPNKNFQ